MEILVTYQKDQLAGFLRVFSPKVCTLPHSRQLTTYINMRIVFWLVVFKVLFLFVLVKKNKISDLHIQEYKVLEHIMATDHNFFKDYCKGCLLSTGWRLQLS